MFSTKQKLLMMFLIVIGLVSGYFIIHRYLKQKSLKYNLILISIDTLRADHMGVYGYKKNTTPNIDQLAKDSKVFSKAYTIFPSTPESFYALFFGRNDVLINSYATLMSKLALSRINLPTFFNSNGYKTAAFITNPTLGEFFSLWKKGFDEFKHYFKYDAVNPDYSSFAQNHVLSINLTNDTIQWLKNNINNKFFLWLHYTNPHSPYFSPIENICRIDKNCSLEKYEKFLKKHVDYNECPLEHIDTQKVESTQNLYDAAILSVDDQIGRFIQELKNQNLYEKSIIVIYGDHGESFEHNTFGHSTLLYQSTIHIPFIIRIPEDIQFQNNLTLIDNADILPTILDLFKIAYKEDLFTGKSFISTISNYLHKTDEFKKSYVYSASSQKKSDKFSILDGKYKYIVSNNKSCLYNNYYEEFYNISEDPFESINLINTDLDKAKTYKDNLQDFLKIQKANTNLNFIFFQDEYIEKIRKMKSLGY